MTARAWVLVLILGCGGGDRSSGAVTGPTTTPSRAPGAFEIDHLWIAVSPGAPERTALEQAGFQVAAKVNSHAGQGTSSVTVELDNGFLELIYADPAVPVLPDLEAVHAQFQKRAD